MIGGKAKLLPVSHGKGGNPPVSNYPQVRGIGNEAQDLRRLKTIVNFNTREDYPCKERRNLMKGPSGDTFHHGLS